MMKLLSAENMIIEAQMPVLLIVPAHQTPAVFHRARTRQNMGILTLGSQ